MFVSSSQAPPCSTRSEMKWNVWRPNFFFFAFSANIKCGVPQGSVPGPLLFLIYINDIFSWSKHLSSIGFADDTNISFQHKNICDLAESVNRELSLVASWFKANKLTLHPDKTKFISFHPLKKKINLDNISVSIDGNKTKRVECTKFLGVIISENLSLQAAFYFHPK